MKKYKTAPAPQEKIYVDNIFLLNTDEKKTQIKEMFKTIKDWRI